MRRATHPTAKGPNVLMIGLDAADCGLIERNLSRLPNIAAIAAGRPLDRLQVEPLSGAVWSTFMTGSLPAAHGVYHHMQWDPQRMTLRRTHPDWIGPIEPFWRDLARSGTRVTAFDVPFVFPGDTGDTGGAVEVANWGSHDLVDRFWSSDKDAEQAVRSVAPRHPMGFEVPVQKTRRALEASLRSILRGIPLKAEACIRLMEAVPSDLFLAVFGEAHRAGHILWPSEGRGNSLVPPTAILEVYEALDTAVGRVVEAAGPDAAVVLFALHGMGPNQSQSHLSSAMLAAALGQTQGAPVTEGHGLVRMLRRSVPASVQFGIANSVPTSVRDFVLAREIAGGRQWKSTPAISLDGDLSGYWRVNLRGREAQGIVDDPEPLLQRIAEEFRRFTTRDGRPLVDNVHFPAQDWAGERAHMLPDLVAEWSPDLRSVDTALYRDGVSVHAPPGTGRTGNHRFRGFCTGRLPDGSRLQAPAHIKEIGQLATTLLEQRPV